MKLPAFLHRKVFLIPAALIAVLVFVFAWQIDFLFTPQVRMASTENGAQVELTPDIFFTFSRPVDRKILIPSMTPDVEGVWVYEKPVYGKHLFRAVRFVPQHTLAPETEYTVRLANIQSAAHIGNVYETAYRFTTQPLPDIASITPEDGAKDISPETTVTVSLNIPNPDIAEFTFAMQPDVTFTTTMNEAGDAYTLAFKKPLAQGTEYTLTAFRAGVVRHIETNEVVHREDPKEVSRVDFATAPPPNIKSVKPNGDQAHVDSAIVIIFSTAMDAASVEKHFSITPDIAGETTLSDDGTTLNFAPTKNLAYATAYDATVSKGAETAVGGSLEEDVVYSFTTIGAARITRTSPQDGNSGVGVNNTITFTFDQDVDHASAESHFSIKPSAPGAFSWDGNTLRYQPSPALTRNVTYTAHMAAGVTSVHGQPLANDNSVRFATEPEVYKIPIAIDFQDQSLSCEAAALKMALAGKGVSVSETDIMNIVGYDSTPHSGSTWGDPYLAYVGNIAGRQNTTGYGVYWDPIAKAAKHWRGSSEAFTGWNITQLTQELAQGNPVVVWGIYGSGYEDSWSTPEGKSIYAWKGEHARTAIGYMGSKDNPSQIIINDPVAGQIYWSRARFESDWGIFGNAGVVVR
ncbi:MAG: Ig-like domain-containing protein [Patescibacteria group bacterium]|jgi:uncharacterized protein YvpB